MKRLFAVWLLFYTHTVGNYPIRQHIFLDDIVPLFWRPEHSFPVFCASVTTSHSVFKLPPLELQFRLLQPENSKTRPASSAQDVFV